MCKLPSNRQNITHHSTSKPLKNGHINPKQTPLLKKARKSQKLNSSSQRVSIFSSLSPCQVTY